jgi:hypothetical protein
MCGHNRALSACVPERNIKPSANARIASPAPEYRTPPPQMMSGFFAAAIACAASRSWHSVAGVRSSRCTRFSKKYPVVVRLALDVLRQQTVTAPVSAGSVSTRMAFIIALISCSGLFIRSKYRHTARNASLVEMPQSAYCSICCSAGSGCRHA